MSRCFISYRHVSPDQELAHALSDSLDRAGHAVFLDSKIPIGARWVEEIERELKVAEFFAVLLSENSIHSDMVRQEVALAHHLAVEEKLRILPIRVAFTGGLPYDLAAYLNPFQQCHWKAGEPFGEICAQIEAAVGRKAVHLPHAGFAPESLDRLARELAVYVGPAARLLVNRAAKSAGNWQQLYDSLAEEIPTNEERKSFLAKRAASR